MEQKNISNINLKPKRFRWGAVMGLFLIILVLTAFGIVFQDKLKFQLDSLNLSNSSADKGKSVVIKTDKTIRKLIDSSGEEIALDEFTLTFPKESIVSPKEITAHSISDIKGLYDGAEFISGAHIDSDDELMAKPAVLAFDIPKGLDPNKIMGFAYDGKGDDLHFYPIEIKNQRVIMKVTHFSGYGIIQVTGADIAPEDPSGLTNVVIQQASRIFYEKQVRQALGEEDDNDDSEKQPIKNLFAQWMDVIIRNYVNPAAEDPRLLRRAALEFQTWETTVNIFLDRDEYKQEVQRFNKAMNSAIDKGASEASKKCTDDYDPAQAIILYEIYRVYQILNQLDQIDDKQWILDAALKCASFKLVISTTFTSDGDDDCPGDVEVYKGEIPINFNQDLTLSGSGEVTGYKEHCGTRCQVTGGSMTQKLRILNTKLVSGNEDKVELLLGISAPQGDTTLDCSYEAPGGYTMGITETNISNWDFVVFTNKLEIVKKTEPEIIVKIKDWEIIKKDNVLARIIYNHATMPLNILGEHELTTFELIHTPK